MVLWVILMVCFCMGMLYFLVMVWIAGGISLKPGGCRDMDHGKAWDMISSGLKVSLIIPVRNEEQNLKRCLESIRDQHFPLHQLQVIIADDHSGDETVRVVSDFTRDHPHLHILWLPAGSADRTGKKAALLRAMEKAEGEIIQQTDADTTRGKKWLLSMTGIFTDPDVRMVIGPVVLSAGDNWLTALQRTEFFGISGITLGTVARGLPVMCNGANLAYRRDVLRQMADFSLCEKVASGDDYFLMESIRRNYGVASIRFNDDPMAQVETNGQTSFATFLSQRMRWASKSKYYTDPFIIFLGALTFFYPLLIVSGLFLWFLSLYFVAGSLFLFLMKMMADYPAVRITARKFGHSVKWIDYLTAQVFQIGYIPLAGFVSLFFRFRWKGRRGR